MPSPCPSAAEVNVIQVTGEVARQEHSRATVTDSVPDPPAGVNDPEEFETVASHRALAGAVMLVDVEAELPQAIEPNATAPDIRSTRTVTGMRDAQRSPRQRSKTSGAPCEERQRMLQFNSPAEHRLSNPLRTRPSGRRLRELCLAVTLMVATGCAGGHALVPRPSTTAPLASAAPLAASISWLSPELARDAAVLARWRAGVGSPIVIDGPATPAGADGLTVVSWNIALGGGDVVPYVRELQASAPGPMVLLLQEAFRSGDDIPVSPVDCAFAGFLGTSQPDREIDSIARELGFSLYYVPSMRNGAPGRHTEDRGNAILTNLDLADLAAIELPFERQRRVAAAATVRGTDSTGRSWSLRFVSAHLDNTGSLRRVWIGAEFGRARQARGLSDALRAVDNVVLGGDFNTWFGFSDRAYHELAREYPQTSVTDTRRTFRGLLRLDHIFYRLPQGWQASVRREESSRGSDHYPLVARLTPARAIVDP